MLDDDAATWSISGDSAVNEGATSTYNVSLSGTFALGESADVDLLIADVDTTSADYSDFDAALTNAVASYTGPGSYSWDGTTLSWTSTAANQMPADLTITLGAVDDITLEASEDFSISLSNPASTTGAAIMLGATNAVTTTINDNDAATVSIAPTTDGDETGSAAGVFTVTLTSPSATDTVVDYLVSGSATSGSDFTPLTGQVTITAGSTSATINVATLDDALIEGNEDVTVTLSGIASGDADISVGGPTVASINLNDNDSATWSITGDATVVEGGAATYAISLSGVVFRTPNPSALTFPSPMLTH